MVNRSARRTIQYLVPGTVLLVVLMAVPLACTATIVPPDTPDEGVPVFVLVQGWTSSLVVAAPDGRLRRYAYGDWHYYALGQNTFPNGVRALMWPSQAALGRADLPGAAEAAHIRRIVPSDAIYEVVVDRAATARLVHEVDAAYTARRATETVNRDYGLRFVEHDAPYTYFHNSNHMVADWLRRLGCTVRGPTFGSRWRVQERE